MLVFWVKFPLVIVVLLLVAPGSKPIHVIGGGSAQAWDRMDTQDESLLVQTKALQWAQPWRAS